MRAAELDLDAMLRRLHLPTIRRLCGELEQCADSEQMSYRDYLAVLVAEEIAHRAQTRITRSVRKAKCPFLGTIEDFDFTFQSSVKLQFLGSFLGPELVSEGRSLILSGPAGNGKTQTGDRHRLPGHPERLRGSLHHRGDADRGALQRGADRAPGGHAARLHASARAGHRRDRLSLAARQCGERALPGGQRAVSPEETDALHDQ